MESSRSTTLAFSDDHIQARWHTNVGELRLADRSVVINTSGRSLKLGEDPEAFLLPWKSTILDETHIRDADSVVIVTVQEEINIGGIALGNGWKLYADIDSNFPKDIPLWISKHDSIGSVELDPRFLTGQNAENEAFRHFNVRANLWYASGNTDCAIHTGHKFIELHTQVHGSGRMQKFRRNDPSTLYEDVYMPPGFTHAPFSIVEHDDSIVYPWHRYFADSDCIWIAFELLPADPG